MTHVLCIRDWYIVRAVAAKGAGEMQMREMYARGTLDGISMLIINVSPLKLAERGRSVSAARGRDSEILWVVKFTCMTRTTRGNFKWYNFHAS